MSTVRIYFNNAFNTVDIPDTVEVLEANSSYADYEISSLNSRSEIGRVIRIKNIDRGYDWNYCRIDDQVYFITNVARISPEVLQLTLAYNPITSRNGSWTVSGVVSRRTPTSYEANQCNNLYEPFSLSEPLNTTVETGDSGWPNISTVSYNYIASMIDLTGGGIEIKEKTKYHYTKDSDGDKIISDVEGTHGYFQTSPALTTSIRMNMPFSKVVRAYATQGYGIYDADSSAIEQNIQLANGYGIPLNSIVIANWSVPLTYATKSPDKDEVGHLKDITGMYDGNLIFKNPTVGYNNRKIKYYFTSVCAMSFMSGASKTYKWADTFGNDDQAMFGVVANPAPNGRPYLLPSKFLGVGTGSVDTAQTWNFSGAVPGGNWYRPTLMTEGRTGQFLSEYQTMNSINNAINNYNAGVSGDFGSGLAAVGDSALNAYQIGNTPITTNSRGQADGPSVSTGLFSGAGSMIGQMLDKTQNLIRGNGFVETGRLNLENGINYAVGSNAIAKTAYNPSYIPPEMPELANLIPNNFVVYVRYPSDNDLKRFDYFLTQYGWASNQVLTNEKIGGKSLRGSNFEYIKMSDCQVFPSIDGKLNPIPGADTIMRGLLVSGVRIWHNGSPKTVSYTEQNIV